MDDFRFCYLEGIFYQHDDVLAVVTDDQETQDVQEALTPFLDRQVHVIMQHLPPEGGNQDLWGQGCCYWQPSGSCPAGHDRDPTFVFKMSMKGTLTRTPEGWVVVSENSPTLLPVTYLEGHRSRMTVVTEYTKPSVDVESETPPRIDEVAFRMKELREIMEMFRKLTNE